MAESEILLQILTRLGNLEKHINKIEKMLVSNKKSQFNIKVKKKSETSKSSKSSKPKTPKKKSKKKSDKKTQESTSKKTLMTEYNNKLLLHGNTYDYKDILKQNGGFWNKELKGWVLPKSSKEVISQDIKNIVTNVLDKDFGLDDDSPVKSFSPPKTYNKSAYNECIIDSDSD